MPSRQGRKVQCAHVPAGADPCLGCLGRSETRGRAHVKVEATQAKVGTAVAIELAVRAGVEDSLETYAEEHLGEPFPEFVTGDDLKAILSSAVTDGVCASLSRLLSFEGEE